MRRKKTEEKKLNLCETSERRLYVERWGQMGKSRGNDIKVFHRTEAQRTAVTAVGQKQMQLVPVFRIKSKTANHGALWIRTTVESQHGV